MVVLKNYEFAPLKTAGFFQMRKKADDISGMN